MLFPKNERAAACVWCSPPALEWGIPFSSLFPVSGYLGLLVVPPWGVRGWVPVLRLQSLPDKVSATLATLQVLGHSDSPAPVYNRGSSVLLAHSSSALLSPSMLGGRLPDQLFPFRWRLFLDRCSFSRSLVGSRFGSLSPLSSFPFPRSRSARFPLRPHFLLGFPPTCVSIRDYVFPVPVSFLPVAVCVATLERVRLVSLSAFCGSHVEGRRDTEVDAFELYAFATEAESSRGSPGLQTSLYERKSSAPSRKLNVPLLAMTVVIDL